ncbi:urease accessory protein UreE [Neobacillus muris]|uniref:urease accessory protein UreE n=1 Tax=Neobacillus muris TaxID=2941334 RepID=UPI00203E66CE|nr:urease accessory protein UreE [Neobacillus muris]
MVITEIVGNIEEISTAGRHIEKVYLSSEDLVKRIQRVTTDHGKELGIRMAEPKDLVDGDILFMDTHNMIIVSVTNDDLLVLRPINMKQMGEIAHQLGNRHLPAQFEGEEMLVQYDYLVEELLVQLKVPYLREQRKVKKAFRPIGHHHG